MRDIPYHEQHRYAVISQAPKESLFLKTVLENGINKKEPLLILNYNKNAQELLLNRIFHNRTNHNNVKCHFIRGVVQNQEIKLSYVLASEMISDSFTK